MNTNKTYYIFKYRSANDGQEYIAGATDIGHAQQRLGAAHVQHGFKSTGPIFEIEFTCPPATAKRLRSIEAKFTPWALAWFAANAIWGSAALALSLHRDQKLAALIWFAVVFVSLRQVIYWTQAIRKQEGARSDSRSSTATTGSD